VGPAYASSAGGALIRLLMPFESGFQDLEALLCNGLYTSCGLHRHSVSWQDRACTASAILRRDEAILPKAAKRGLAHLRMLREVMRRVDNADNSYYATLVVAVHSSCQSSVPLLGSVHC
jgi:hypothetical protein